jgi:diguanylate cyclase (GGDEF)-like protein
MKEELFRARLAPAVTPQAKRLTQSLIRAASRSAESRGKLEAELWSMALTDELTGLFNRRGFLLLAEQQLKLARRRNWGALLFFADVDGLKQINDSGGHAEGDRALVAATDILRSTFRDSDILARFGGDEFAALALEASGRDQITIAARMRRNLDRYNSNLSRFSLSLSVGIARFDGETSLDDLLISADQAMYERKRQSREPQRLPDSPRLV